LIDRTQIKAAKQNIDIQIYSQAYLDLRNSTMGYCQCF